MKKIIGFITMVMMVLGLFACETEQVGSAEVSEVTTTTIQYVIEFNGNGGNGSMESIVLKTAEKKAIPQNKFNAPLGKKFSHWNDASDDSGSSYNEGKEVSDLSKVDGTIVTLYAVWTAATYTISYRDKDDAAFSGEWNGTPPTTHIYNEETALILPHRDGYRFDGWYLDSQCAGESVTVLAANDAAANITMYAKWTAGTSVITIDRQIITYDELELTIDYDDNLKQFTVSSPAETLNAANCTWYLDGETVLSESLTYSPDYDSLLGGHHSVTVMYLTETDGYSAQTEFTMTKSY